MDTRSMLIGAAAGSMVMYMLDPNGGRRRRALARDKMTRATPGTRDGLDATARDIANRARGLAARRGRSSGDTVSDDRLAARVRAKLGRATSHPSAIEVIAHDGHVVLRGPILASEIPAVLGAVAAVPGVAAVSDTLEPHETAGTIPALQGEGRAAGSSLDVLQRHWSPSTRAMLTAGVVATGAWMAMNLTRGRNGAEYTYGSL